MKKLAFFAFAIACFSTTFLRADSQLAPKNAPPMAWSFNRANDFQGWTPNNFERLEATKTGLRGLTKYDSSLLMPETRIDAASRPIFEFKAKSDTGGGGEIFFRHEGEVFAETRQANHSIIGDGQWHVYRVDLRALPTWNGVITQIRFDLLNAAGANIEVASVRLLTADDGGNLLPNGDFENTSNGVADGWKLSGNLKSSMASGAPNGEKNSLQFSGSGAATLQAPLFDLPQTGQQTFTCEYSLPRGQAKLEIHIAFFDVFDQLLFPRTSRVLAAAPTQNWRRLATTFQAPARAASGRVTLRLRAESDARFLLDRVSLRGAKLALAGFESGNADAQTNDDGLPQWRAAWIAPAKRTVESATPRLFRRSFQIANVAQIESARVLATADNTAQVWVNGKALPPGKSWKELREPDLYDIRPHLQSGANVVAILSTNTGYVEGVLAEIGIRFQGGKTTHLQSDATWRAIERAPFAGWSRADFDDADWPRAQVVARAGAQPWGAIPYLYLGAAMPISVRDFRFPARGEIGSRAHFSATLTPRAKPSRPLQIVLEASPVGDEKSATVFFRRALGTRNWRAGIPVKIGPWPLQLPRFVRAGKYLVRVRVPYAALSTANSTREYSRDDWLEKPLQLTMPYAPKSPVARVKYLGGQVPAFVIDGKTFPVMHHMENDTFTTRSLDNIRTSGVPLMWLSFNNGFGWKPNGKHDFRAIDRIIAKVLGRNPNTFLVLNVPFDPVYNAAMRETWPGLHSSELVRDETGKTDIGIYNGAVQKAQSYASRAWMRDAVQSARALVRHVRGSSYASRVIGYVPISGISWEWFYWGAQSQEFVDYSPPFLRGFREYSRAKYGNISALNAAWKTTYASFDNVPIPTRQQRLQSDAGLFLDPRKSAAVITLREYFSHVISGALLEICAAIKAESRGDALTGTYYGYVTYVAGPYVGNHTGHFALSRVLASKSIDFLMSPSRYDDRGIGGGSGFMTTADSFKLHGKLYIDQADIRTFRATGAGGQVGRAETVRESAAILLREAANAFVNGVAPQWYDFSLGWTTGDARLMDAVKRAREIEIALQKTPRKTLNARNSIAVIVDEKSVKYTALESAIHHITANVQIESLHRSGAAFDQYLLDDLEKLPPYKCYLFLNTFRISQAQRKYIDAKLKRGGNTLIWIYAPGITDGEKLDFARASQISGIDLKASENETVGRVTRATDTENEPLFKGTSRDFVYGAALPQGPRFYADDKAARVLANIENSAQAGLVVKKFPTWTSIYSAASPLPPQLLRNIARGAGIPIVNESNSDITYVSDRVFAVHTYGGGARTFSLPVKSGVIKELVRGANYQISGGKFRATLPEKSTSIFLLSEK